MAVTVSTNPFNNSDADDKDQTDNQTSQQVYLSLIRKKKIPVLLCKQYQDFLLLETRKKVFCYVIIV